MQPLISVITVSYNAAMTIELTIQSVLQQAYSRVEYIIIDGGSTDGTIEIIKQYEEQLAYWVSEPDNGIYDAMNKGVDRAKGDYAVFLGADDSFVDGAVLSMVADFISEHSVDILSGRVIAVEEEAQIIAGCETALWKIKSGVMLPHQGLFVRKQLLLEHPFNTEMRIYADYEQLLTLVLSGIKIHYIRTYITYYSLNGASAINGEQYLAEKIKVIIDQCGYIYGCFFLCRIIKSVFMKFIKAILRKAKLYMFIREKIYCFKRRCD